MLPEQEMNAFGVHIIGPSGFEPMVRSARLRSAFDMLMSWLTTPDRSCLVEPSPVLFPLSQADSESASVAAMAKQVRFIKVPPCWSSDRLPGISTLPERTVAIFFLF